MASVVYILYIGKNEKYYSAFNKKLVKIYKMSFFEKGVDSYVASWFIVTLSSEWRKRQ